MNAPLDALLALQSHDHDIQALDRTVAALAPRVAKLDTERQQSVRAADGARAAVEREEERVRELSGRADDFRRMNARAVSQMEMVRTTREATAATSQVDISRRALAEVEADLTTAAQRLAALRSTASAAADRVAALEEEQAEARARIAAERAEIEQELVAARAERGAKAERVDPRTLARYDRVRHRRQGTAVFPLRGYSCGNCDTAIPTQRRNAMTGGAIDVCESCGVLLYTPPTPVTADH